MKNFEKNILESYKKNDSTDIFWKHTTVKNWKSFLFLTENIINNSSPAV